MLNFIEYDELLYTLNGVYKNNIQWNENRTCNLHNFNTGFACVRTTRIISQVKILPEK